MLGWNDELATALRRELRDAPGVADVWAGWASEIAADSFAFAHVGYAAVAALHDVIAGEPESIFALLPADPHPIAYLRVLLGTQMCVRFYGAGPWDDLAQAWTRAHPISEAPRGLREFLSGSVERLPRIVDVCLMRPMAAFGGRAFAALVDPARVRPDALDRLVGETGPSLFVSPHLIWTECLRLLAHSGYRSATEPERAAELAQEFERWMLPLGHGIPMAA